MHDLHKVADAFQIPGDIRGVTPYGSGHINDTYVVTVDQAGVPVRYLLQRINHKVFTDVPALMANVQRVCEHTRNRLIAEGCEQVSRRCLTLVPTRDGQAYHHDERGNDWRVYLFIEGATGHDIIESTEQARSAAYAFGTFLKCLADLPGDRLHETIPDFHHMRKRFGAFELALRADALDRAAAAKPEIEWLLARRDLAGSLLKLHAQGELPERITHNDTKLGNVLIDDATHEAICVIDIDTVMPGLAAYDFGDLVRTSTSPVAEDEPDVRKVTMRMPMFEALASGYLQAAGDFLTPAEVKHLPLGAMVITMTIGMRFLTDYLQGDRYYKPRRPEHNLERCRTQWALVDSMEAQCEAMDRCIVSLQR